MEETPIPCDTGVECPACEKDTQECQKVANKDGHVSQVLQNYMEMNCGRAVEGCGGE